MLLWIKAQLDKPDTWLYFGIILSVLFVVLFLVVLVLRKRIAIATALVKEGSKWVSNLANSAIIVIFDEKAGKWIERTLSFIFRAVSSIWSSILFPIFPWIFQLAVAGFAVVIGLYLLSVGHPVNQIVRMQNDTSCVCTGIASHYTVRHFCPLLTIIYELLNDQYFLEIFRAS